MAINFIIPVRGIQESQSGADDAAVTGIEMTHSSGIFWQFPYLRAIFIDSFPVLNNFSGESFRFTGNNDRIENFHWRILNPGGK